MSDRQRNKKNEIQSLFAKLGVKFGLKPQAVDRQMKKLLGSERFEEYLNLSEKRNLGLADISGLYALMESPQEANLLWSHQSRELLEIAAWIDTKVSGVVRPGCRIGELGCATGPLVAWLASEHPDNTVVGVDRVETFIRSARSSVILPNSRFEVWDYGTTKPDIIEPFDVLVCSLGIDFALRKRHESLESEVFRRGACYDSHKSFAAQIFSKWREAANDGSHLFTVLRIPSFTHLIGVVDAACEAGWALNIQGSTKIKVGEEQFPALAFLARPSDLPREDDLAAFWVDESIENAFSSTYIDTMAVAVYRSLKDKEVIDTGDKVFDDGHRMRTMIVRSGAFGLLFSQATTGMARLQIVPATKIGKLKIRFDWG